MELRKKLLSRKKKQINEGYIKIVFFHFSVSCISVGNISKLVGLISFRRKLEKLDCSHDSVVYQMTFSVINLKLPADKKSINKIVI